MKHEPTAPRRLSSALRPPARGGRVSTPGRARCLTWTTWAVMGCALVAASACRGTDAATPSDVVMQFYTMRDAVGVHGAPTAKELAALRPFIADTLADGLVFADSLRTADMLRAPDEKPAFVEGDLFSGVEEGYTSFRVMPALPGEAPYAVPVEFADDRWRPIVRWTDTAVVVVERGRLVLQDIRYSGTTELETRATLLDLLKRP